ncbi:hypothetical protein ACFV42_23425 [Streptomyces solisilvae]|uniref:hypothetical protein n=1 Tax=Streptomyces malaysiensis TaxID=92644 RepID=UPI0036A108A7
MSASGRSFESVELETNDQREILFADGGILTIPKDTVANRVRSWATRRCPSCPDINQGLMSQETVGEDGVPYLCVVYRDCGHVVIARLDVEGQWRTERR